ncbi:MAG: hypothetical protein N2C12_12420, partial [Planctomycetales bacterium]
QGKKERFSARWCFVFNLPVYGFGLRFVPDANGHDALLDVCLFQRGGFLSALRYASSVYLRHHQRLPDCRIIRASQIRVTSDQPVPYQLDGDPIGSLPMELDTVPGRVTLLVSDHPSTGV